MEPHKNLKGPISCEIQAGRAGAPAGGLSPGATAFWTVTCHRVIPSPLLLGLETV